MPFCLQPMSPVQEGDHEGQSPVGRISQKARPSLNPESAIKEDGSLNGIPNDTSLLEDSRHRVSNSPNMMPKSAFATEGQNKTSFESERSLSQEIVKANIANGVSRSLI